MAFSSNIGRCPVIDDSNAHEFIGESAPNGGICSYAPRDYERQPEGSVPFTGPLDMPNIARDEWKDRIEYMEQTESRLSDAFKRGGVPVLNQGRTNYCWINGVVHAVMLRRYLDGQPMQSLSPASAGAKIKNYRNVGGWGAQAIEGISKYGLAPVELWPANAIDRSHDTDQTRRTAAKYKVDEWYELRSNDFDQMASCLLRGMPVPIGLNWWRHLVCALDLVVLDNGEFGTMIINSWGTNWGDGGFGVLTERKSTAYEQNAVRTITVSR